MPRRAAVCGTEGGYYRHVKGRSVPKTKPCDACKEAHRLATEVRTANAAKKNKVLVPCSGCGDPCLSGRCSGCGVRAGNDKRKAKNAEKRARELEYKGQWAVVDGILRPVKTGTWVQRDGGLQSVREAS